MKSILNANLVLGKFTIIPVQLGSAAESGEKISFSTLHRCDEHKLTPVKLRKWCPTCDEEAEEVTKGYKIESGVYVEITEDDLAPLDLVLDSNIKISEFVPWVDPLHFDKNYYLMPKGEVAEGPYGVLRDSMLATGMVAIAQYTAWGREQLCAIRPAHLALVLTTLHYGPEVREPDFHCPGESDEQACALMSLIISELASPMMLWSKYTNKHTEALRAIINAKLAGEEYIAPADEEPVQVDPVDWLENLKLSVAEVRRRREELV